MKSFTQKKCVPCEGNISPLSDEKENEYMLQIPGWVLNRESVHHLSREFVLGDFKESMKFIHLIAELAEEEGHHPDIHIFYNKVKLELYTHAIKGLHDNDFILAAKINEIKV